MTGALKRNVYAFSDKAIDRALPIAGWMEPDELRWLASFAMSSKVIIEVGSYLGRSTRALADATCGVVYAVDTWGGFDDIEAPNNDEHYRRFLQNMWDMVAMGRVRPIRTDSLLWSGVKDVDLVFLDGDHSEARVAAEIEKYSAMLREGGVLAGHDYWSSVHPGVTAAVDKWCPWPLQRGPGSIWWAQKEEES